ncbi:PREDICTED: clotting factor B-like [Rhagoletis zephyria]|uniref:clotting factor B-like n=1 Tax=Rhagoletis zephyria TaxID=28612 RepID=UPI0008112251|nr:PREDICTED: clotting factor B-like [Rhagoletis zephyria]
MTSTLDPANYSVGVGSIHITELQMHQVAAVFVHPQYQRKQKFDIALMKLATPLAFSTKIKAVCLPEYSFEPLNANKARVIGWGYHHFKVKKVSASLQEVDLDVIPLERCRTMYEPIKQDIIRSQICTWSDRKDACSGDSGGPLFVYLQDKAVLYGIVSFGVTCADEFPGVYTAVSYYLNWMNKIMTQN